MAQGCLQVNRSFDVVTRFEELVAEFAGAKYGVAVATGTWAIFLSCRYCFSKSDVLPSVILPPRTFISVPMAVIHAGGTVKFDDMEWKGVYQLWPYPIYDGALRWHRGMYKGGLHCLSFHARKSLPMGEGGMVLTDDRQEAEDLRAMRYSGRRGPAFRVEDISELGFQAYMTPEKAARGLHLMDYTHDCEDQEIEYPDLREVPLFKVAPKTERC